MNTMQKAKALARNAVRNINALFDGGRSYRAYLDALVEQDRALALAARPVVSPVWYDTDGNGWQTVTDQYGSRIVPAVDIWFEQVKTRY